MCYCCKEKCVKISMIVLNILIIIPGVLLFIFGGLFAKDIAILTNTTEGQQLNKVATGITYLFGAMACYIGLVGFAVGCCYGKC